MSNQREMREKWEALRLEILRRIEEIGEGE